MIHRLLDRLAERYSEREHKLEAIARARGVLRSHRQGVRRRRRAVRGADGGVPRVVHARAAARRHRPGRRSRAPSRKARRSPPTSAARWPRSRPATTASSSCSRRTVRCWTRGSDRRRALRACASAASRSAWRPAICSRRASCGTARRSSSARHSCSIRPTRARWCSSSSSARLSTGVAREGILFHLSRQHIRWHRHGHVGAAKVYRDA